MKYYIIGAILGYIPWTLFFIAKKRYKTLLAYTITCIVIDILFIMLITK